jgi:hypothetical protein
VDANLLEEHTTLLVLYEEACKTLQHVSILTSVPTEEYLVGTEYGAYAIYGNLPVTQNVQVVIPELVLYEKRRNGTHRTKETTCVGNGVDRQICYDVGTRIVLPYLVARRREEGKEDFVVGMFQTNAFYDGTSLFELTE